MAIHPAERIIVALDGMAPDQALAFTAQLQGLRWVKVGLELFVVLTAIRSTASRLSDTRHSFSEIGDERHCW